MNCRELINLLKQRTGFKLERRRLQLMLLTALLYCFCKRQPTSCKNEDRRGALLNSLTGGHLQKEPRSDIMQVQEKVRINITS